jgi:hypothetical protein
MGKPHAQEGEWEGASSMFTSPRSSAVSRSIFFFHTGSKVVSGIGRSGIGAADLSQSSQSVLNGSPSECSMIASLWASKSWSISLIHSAAIIRCATDRDPETDPPPGLDAQEGGVAGEEVEAELEEARSSASAAWHFFLIQISRFELQTASPTGDSKFSTSIRPQFVQPPFTAAAAAELSLFGVRPSVNPNGR